MAAVTYVVSIYRRSGKAENEITVLVERTGSGERKSFSSGSDLWTFLSRKPSSPTGTTKRKNKSDNRA